MKATEETVVELDKPESFEVDDRADAFEPVRQGSHPDARASGGFIGALLGRLVGWAEPGRPLVEFEGSLDGRPLPARLACAAGVGDVGRDAVLLFEGADPARPILMGLLQAQPTDTAGKSLDVRLDGEQLTFSAKNEIILRCGKASITLTRAGKVLIRGAYLLSRSSGANRIKGGSVQIN